jgi:thiaminase (transcriptional activator TenA)
VSGTLDPRPSAHMRRRADAVWAALHTHPFVTGLADGTLDKESFAFFVRQDHRFLLEYVRTLAYGVARAPDLAGMRYFLDAATTTVRTELATYQEYARVLGIGAEELAAEEAAPATQAYADFLVRCAAQGDFAELAAAVLPCTWSYVEVGQRLLAEGAGATGLYGDWLQAYAAPELADLVTGARRLVDDAVARSGGALLERATAAFLTSSRYELGFWDGVLHRRRWPV